MGANQIDLPQGFVVAEEPAVSLPSDFSAILGTTLGYEGGFVVDPAGPTNKGVTQNTYDLYRNKKGLSRRSVAEIGDHEVEDIYYNDFYKDPGFSSLPTKTSGVLFDYGVHSGPVRATKALQRVVGALEDGILGPKTQKAVTKYIQKNGENSLINGIITDRENYLHNITESNPDLAPYRKGFMNRMNSLRKQYLKSEIDFSNLNPFSVPAAEAGQDPDLLPQGFVVDDGSGAPGLPEGFIEGTPPPAVPKGFVPIDPNASPHGEIRTGKPPKPPGFWDGVKKIFRMSPEEEAAKVQNIAMISRETGLSLQEAAKNYDQLVRDPKITGIKPGLSNEEFTALVMAPGLIAGAATAPVATAVGLLAFSGLDKIIDLKRFVPEDASDPVKTAVGLVDFIGKGLLTHKFLKASPGLIEKYTKQKLTEYKLPQTVQMTRDEVADLYQTGKLTPADKKDLYKALNLTREQRLRAVKEGITIEVPAEKIVKYVDQPWFAKIKDKLAIGRAAETFPQDPLLAAANKQNVQRSFPGSPMVAGPVRGALPAPGEVPPLPAGFTIASKEAGRRIPLSAEDTKMVNDLYDLISVSEGPQTIRTEEGFSRLGSGFPSFFQNKGYTQKGVLEIIDKVRAGTPLTDKQESVFRDVFEGFKKEMAEKPITPIEQPAEFVEFQKLPKGFQIRGAEASPGRAGATIEGIANLPPSKGYVGKKPEFKLFEQSRALAKKYAERIGERYTAGNLGIYHGDTKNIRVNAMNNVSTVAHEIAHHVDTKTGATATILKPIKFTGGLKPKPVYDPATLPIRQEMTKIYTDKYPGALEDHPLPKRMREGFAVLIQNYIAEPEAIAKEYPNIVREFLTTGGKYYDPIVGEFIRDARQIVLEYRNLDPLAKIGARVATDPQNTDKKSFLNLKDRIYTEVADQIYPFEKLAAGAGAGFTQNDPSLWLRAYENSSYLIVNNIQGKRGFWTLKNGNFVRAGDRNWRDLVDMLSKKDNIGDFGYWLVARDQYFAFKELDRLTEQAKAALKELETIRDTGSYVTKTELNELKDKIEKYKRFNSMMERNNLNRWVVEQAYLQNKDRFVAEEKLFDELERHNLNLLVDPEVQLISKKKYAELADKQGYAPLKRDLFDEILGDEREGPSVPIRVGKTKVSSQIGRTGSERTIINPVYSGIKDHAEIVRKALKQVVYNKIGKLGGKYPELFQRTKLLRHKDPKTGVLTYPQERDPNIIMARENHERVPYIVDKELKGIMDEILTFQNINILENLLTQFSRFFTKGTTGLYLPFAGTNFLIDQITAGAQTRNKLIPVLDPVKDILKGAMREDTPEAKYLAEYFVLGGDRQTFVGWQDLSPSDLFRQLTGEKTALEKLAKTIVRAEDVLAFPAKVSEIMTRAAEYIKGRQSGKSQIAALEEAGRITAPFHHIGRLGGGRFLKTYVKSIPYFNPSLQVLAQFGQTLKDPRFRKRALFVTLMVIASMISGMGYIMGRGTRKQKDLYKDLPAEMLGMYIFFPSADGEKLHRIRIPDQMGSIGALINMALLQMMKITDYTVKDYVDAGTQFVPDQFNVTSLSRQIVSLIPQLVRPAMETILNSRTFPKITPLEGEALQAREPQFRVGKNTSNLARFLGQKLKLSPVKIDHLVEGYMGRAVKFITGKEVANPFVQEYYFTSGRNLMDFYDKKEKNNEAYNSLINRRREMSDDEKRKVIVDRARIKAIDTLLENYRTIEDKKILGREDLSPEEQSNLENTRIRILDLIETL